MAPTIVNRYDPEAGRFDIWSLDVARGISSRVTFEPDNEFAPLWSKYDIVPSGPGGLRFLVPAPAALTVVLNWRPGR